MTGKVKPEVTIQLGGRERHLRFDLNAMAAFEKATGKNLFEAKVAKELAKNLSPVLLRALLWACLCHEDESLTLEQVGGMITRDNMAEINNSLWDAYTRAVPEKEEGEEEAP